MSPGVADISTVVFEAPTATPIEFNALTIGPDQGGGSTIQFDTGQLVNVNSLTMIRGDLLGSSPINVANFFDWRTGNIRAGGDLALNGDSVVRSTSSARTISRDVINAGNFTMLGGFSLGSGAQLTNLPTGVYDGQGTSPRLSGGTFHNEGLLLKSTSDGVGDIYYTDFVNAGTVEIQTGRINMQQASYVQTAGQTILSGGDFSTVLFANPMAIEGGTLMGIGTLTTNVANIGGTTAPGLSAGELTVDGDYTQGVNAMLDIEIGGANPGEFDVLTVTGTATLSGELRVTDIDGFVPQLGNTFVILTAAVVTGTFDTETVPDHYEVVYSTTDVTVQFALPSPDLNGDGLIDLKDVALFQVCYASSGQPPSANCATNVSADLDVDGDVDLDDYRLLFVAMTQ